MNPLAKNWPLSLTPASSLRLNCFEARLPACATLLLRVFRSSVRKGGEKGRWMEPNVIRMARSLEVVGWEGERKGRREKGNPITIGR
jgi:hypothetical protein